MTRTDRPMSDRTTAPNPARVHPRAASPRSGLGALSALTLAALFTLALTLVACGGAPPPAVDEAHAAHVARSDAAAEREHPDAAGHADHARHDGHAELGADEPADFSIYHAESVWTDQTGTERPLGSLANRTQVVAMVYTSCAYACPRIMLDMKRIEGELGADRDDVGFVLVTIDPERDTPDRLAEFARGSRLGPAWTLLTGDEGDILELAALLGVQYRETAPGEFVHSNLITVLDPDGRVVHRQIGLGADPTTTLEAIRGLAG